MSAESAGTCFICVTCGSQFPPTERAPLECPICLDERQYVGAQGQQWTALSLIPLPL